MSFEMTDKVAIITGGATNLGLKFAKNLIEHGIRGVTIADLNEEAGLKAERELNSEFGENKALFVKTDVTDYKSFENAFVSTVYKFKNVDVLINNAEICDDSIWEQEVAVNVRGTINGILLAFENYILRYKSGPEGIICNVSSIYGLSPSKERPIYTGTKFAIHGMTLAWGCQEHYERTNIKVVGVCPGTITTHGNKRGSTLGEPYEDIRRSNVYSHKMFSQTVEQCAKHMMEILKTAKTGTVWVIETNEKQEYMMADYSHNFIKSHQSR